MNASPDRRPLRWVEIVILAIFAAVILVPFFGPWGAGFRSPPLDTGAELRAQQREDFRLANPGPPFRSFRSDAIPQAVTVFSSGPQDTIRSDLGGVICSIVDVDVDHGYLIWIPQRTGLAEYQLANVRFCDHLVLMGNPNIELIEQKLRQLPKPPALADLLQPLGQPQQDGPFQFSDLAMVQENGQWSLTGRITSSAEESPQYCWFHYELHQGAQIARGQIEVQDLKASQPANFVALLPASRRDLVWEPQECRLKIVLRVTGDRRFDLERRN